MSYVPQMTANLGKGMEQAAPGEKLEQVKTGIAALKNYDTRVPWNQRFSTTPVEGLANIRWFCLPQPCCLPF
jgi:hypothetical protein